MTNRQDPLPTHRVRGELVDAITRGLLDHETACGDGYRWIIGEIQLGVRAEHAELTVHYLRGTVGATVTITIEAHR